MHGGKYLIKKIAAQRIEYNGGLFVALDEAISAVCTA